MRIDFQIAFRRLDGFENAFGRSSAELIFAGDRFFETQRVKDVFFDHVLKQHPLHVVEPHPDPDPSV